MGRAIADRRDAVFLMTKVCTHGRDGRVAMRQLEESLRRLRTDYLDLWQIHECVYYNDPEHHFAAGGVVEALERAKAQGKVRYVGFTGHKDPEIHLRMLTSGFPFDACQLPLNGFDADFRSFQHKVLPALARRRIAAIGMKSLGGNARAVTKKIVKVDAALRYAMSLPVCTTVSGIDSLKVLRQNLRVARGFTPMSQREQEAYETSVQGLRYRRTVRALQDDGRTRGRSRPQAARLPLGGRARALVAIRLVRMFVVHGTRHVVRELVVLGRSTRLPVVPRTLGIDRVHAAQLFNAFPVRIFRGVCHGKSISDG